MMEFNRTVGVDLAQLEKLRQIAFEQLRQQALPGLFIRDQLAVQRVPGKALGQKLFHFGQILFLHAV